MANVGGSIESAGVVQEGRIATRPQGLRMSMDAENPLVAKVQAGGSEVEVVADPATDTLTVRIDGVQIYPADEE